MSFQVFGVAAGQNTGTDHDSSGAFVPGAHRFAEAFGGSYKTFDNSHRAKRNFLKAIEEGPGSLDIFAYFGHGWRTQLGSANIFTDADCDEFVRVLQQKLKPGGTVIFYACWAGIESGFTTKFKNKMDFVGYVYGHTSAGHSFMNPDVSEISNSQGYRRLYPLGSDLRGAWNKSLHYTDMWLRFPITPDQYIERELYAIRLLGDWRLNVGGATRNYKFTWSKGKANAASLEDVCVNPTGKVKEAQTNIEGTWEISDTLQIRWNSGLTENWSLPLNPRGQTGTMNGTSFTAVRVKNDNPGRLQG